MPRLATTIEAILYLKAQPLTIGEIADYARCDRADVEEGLMELMDDYAHRDSALEIVETADGYVLQLRTLFQTLVQTIIPIDLGVGALRTLAAIALRGPIAQSDLVELRGSGVYQQVPELIEKGFVRKRRQKDSRSAWLQVTEKFHQYFQLEESELVLAKQRTRLPSSEAAIAAMDEVLETISDAKDSQALEQ